MQTLTKNPTETETNTNALSWESPRTSEQLLAFITGKLAQPALATVEIEYGYDSDYDNDD